MNIQDNFWKLASQKIEDLFENPRKLKNEDLLIPNLEDASAQISPTLTSKVHFRSKISSFNNRYTNYKPLFMTILKNSQKLSVYHKMLNRRTPSPTSHKKINLQSTDEILPIYNSNLEIYGQRAGFSFLPKISNPIKIKNFILQVREKYVNLYQQLCSDNGIIKPQGIMDYLFKQSAMKKHFFRTKIGTQREYRSESTIKKSRVKCIDKDHANYIQDQAKLIMVCVI